MPRPPSGAVQIAIRVPPEWLDMADDLVETFSRPGMPATRTDVLRCALIEGLEKLMAHRDAAGSRSKRKPKRA